MPPVPPAAAFAAASAASVTAAAAAAAASRSAAARSAADFLAASSLARLALSSLASASGSGTYPGSSWMRLRFSPTTSSVRSSSAPRRLRRSPRGPSPGMRGKSAPPRSPPPPLWDLCLAIAAHRCTRLGSSWPASSWMVSSSACARETTLRPSTTSKPFSSSPASAPEGSTARSCSSEPQYVFAALTMRWTSLRKASIVAYVPLSTFHRSVDRSMGSLTFLEYPGSCSSSTGEAKSRHCLR
mmetsp:Transcript_7882/g.35246  ORF Transcript_7882/g.35246 Transcript_7882/m.35246 type:complete len:242 (+) Transcript_7882:1215-1940(+)